MLMAMLVLVSSFTFTACNEDDQLDTNQFKGGVSLLSFGPCPVARGGELTFIGTGLNQISSITIPGCADVTDITRVSNNEIKIIVPKTAEPGFVVLHYGKGEITTKTRLTFTEPIGFAKTNFDKATIKPGETLTINGTYLHLVESVIFAEDVKVSELECSSPAEPMDETIKVVVPAEAQTGKIFLSFYVNGDTIPNQVLSDDILTVVLPSVAEIANLTGKKPGDKIELAGKDLDLVTKVTVADEEVEFAVADGKVSFELPVSTPSVAEIAMYPASGVKVTIATIGMTLPTELVATPAAGLRNGDEVTISGKDLDVVKAVKFPGVDAEVEFNTVDGNIVVKCPEGFTSGNIELTTNSGVVVTVAIETLKPTFTSFAEAEVSMGNDVTINGENLDLVVKVLYSGAGEGSVLEGATPTQIVVSMPASGPESGVLTLVMANGETAETGALTINAPEFCNIIGWPELGEGEMIQAGDLMTVTIANGEHLTGVEINGEPMQFIVNGDKLIMLTPYAGKPGSIIKLISDNGSIEYTYDFKPNTEIETVIWTGLVKAGNWADACKDLSWGGYDWSTVKAGTILRVKFTVDPEVGYCQMRFGNGSWNALPGTKEFEGADNDGNISMPADATSYEFALTQEMIDEMVANGGLVVCGTGFIITKISLVEKVSLEEEIWKGEAVVGGWSGSMGALSWGGYDWSTVSVGKTLRIHFKINPAKEYDAVIRAGNGSWAALPSWKLLPGSDNEGNVPISEDGSLEIKLTQEDLDELVNNGGLVVCGAWFIATKVGLE